MLVVCVGTKFHIYKTEGNREIDELINGIKDRLDDFQYHEINQNDFRGFLFFSESDPVWSEVIGELVDEDIGRNILNRYSSYILLKSSGENIYVIAGGNGYRYIDDIIEKDFGLNLVPKLVTDGDNVIKKIVDNPFTGNRMQIQRTNRKPTNIIAESDLSNVYRELKIAADANILEDLGIEDVESASIINKNFISIEKSLELDDLEVILDSLNEIYQRPVNFALNPFKSIEKTNYSGSDLKKVLINYIRDRNFDQISFDIVGSDISSYLENDCYSLHVSEYFNFELKEPLEWHHLKDKLEADNYTKKFIENLFYHTNLMAYDNEGNNTLDLELITCLYGSIIIEEDFNSLVAGEEFYLLNGKWYILDESLNNFFDNKFDILYAESREFIINRLFNMFPCIMGHWNNLNEGFDENDYNDSFVGVDEVIMAHRYKQKNIELADLITYDEERDRLNIICVKRDAGASGCRDLFGQIESSIYYVKNYFVNNLDNEANAYYRRLYNKNNEVMPIEEDKFVNLFRNGKFCYVAAFLDENAFDDLSYFGKILSYNVSCLLASFNTDIYLLDYRFGFNLE